ncbi:MAG: NTP transferase domain-containing protein, partial [Desulfovibrio sp.]|nr:NTP transferase domain-containing protein [Desulfovibrio sp.]
MTTPCSAILGVLLAGGEASRMGQNKALLSLGENSETFLARTYDLLGQVLESRIVVTRSANIYPNYPCVLDACERKGPLGALWTALRLARFFGHKAILAVACDQPFLTY